MRLFVLSEALCSSGRRLLSSINGDACLFGLDLRSRLLGSRFVFFLPGAFQFVCLLIADCVSWGPFPPTRSRFDPVKRKLFMSVKLYVGNLPFSISENELTDLFSASGQVDSAQIVTNRETGRSRG